MSLNLPQRPRRNRQTEAIRQMVKETCLTSADLIYPLFVKAAPGAEAIRSMSGVNRHDIRLLVKECKIAERLGIPAVAIFPCVETSLKDAVGSAGFAADNILYQAVRAVKKACPGLIVITDVALDPYTNHGHDGVLSKDGKSVANDETVELLCQLAIREAEAGADIVAPSDMMDGRVAAIRAALDQSGFADVLILSYAAKYASAFYGPFRDAVGSKVGKDSISKATYQMDPANVREAIREIQLDEKEGADWLMVKPAGAYLDVIRAVREASTLPLAAYQVSGEYAQIHAAAKMGWLDYERTRDESLIAIKRAGADMILTYFAREVAEGFSKR